MLIGTRHHFAIEYDIQTVAEDWVFGRFYIITSFTVIGNQEDTSVDLKGCLRWLDDFICTPKNRDEPGLLHMSKQEIFIRLAKSVLVGEDINDSIEEYYEDTYSRFHISHIGMSSFDSVTLLLIQDNAGTSRFVWKDRFGTIYDLFIPTAEMHQVFSATADALRKDIADATR